jgi:hypothetical protein
VNRDEITPLPFGGLMRARTVPYETLSLVLYSPEEYGLPELRTLSRRSAMTPAAGASFVNWTWSESQPTLKGEPLVQPCDFSQIEVS